MNARLPPSQRARMLVAAMTLDQKIQMVHGDGYPGTGTGGMGAGAVPAITSLCVPALGLADGAGGLGNDNTGVTAFPAPLAQAAAFDRAQQTTFGQALGQEFVGKAENQWLGPNVNIARYPLDGRNFEAYGEDPYLSGQTAVAGIDGVQSQHVIATVKHYMANNSETNRRYESSNVDDRTMHEIYLPAFEAAVTQGHAGSVMCAYNRVNGIYACSNDHIQNVILKGRAGFDGFIVSDWYRAAHKVTDANAGLDMEMPGAAAFANLKKAVETGVVSMARLNDMAYRITSTMFRLGLFDHPLPPPAANVSTGGRQALALKMAEEGSVLLKNDGGLLPLTGKRETIAVIGDVGPGGSANVCTGSGSASVNCNPVDPLSAIRARASKNGDTVLFDNGSDPAVAAATAAEANVAIVFGDYKEHEGANRSTLALDGKGDALVADVAAANPHTVAVLMTGGPTLMPWLAQVQGVLEAWYPGVEMGNAVAALLFGDANPSGHLPETFPKSQADLPTAGSPIQQCDACAELYYTERLKVGYRWYDSQSIAPLFPFGYGLSYTTFSFGSLNVARTATGALVSFTVMNTGKRAGAEVAQVYVGDPSAADEPPHQLKGYARVQLNPGHRETVRIPLDQRAFSIWDPASQSWTVTPGCYSISVGGSSRSLPLSASIGMGGGAC